MLRGIIFFLPATSTDFDAFALLLKYCDEQTMSLTLKQAIEQFNRSMIGQIKANSLKTYNAGLKVFLKYFGDSKIVQTITLDDLDEWRYWLAFKYEVRGRRSPAESTQRLYLTGVHHLLRWLFERDKITKDLSVKFTFEPARKKSWTDAEDEGEDIDSKAIRKEHLASMIHATQVAKDYRTRAIFLFMANTGARVSSICALKVGKGTHTWREMSHDFDFVNGDVLLNEKRARLRIKGNKQLWVYFNDRTATAIRDYLFWERGFIAGKLFPDVTGSGIWRLCDKYARICGLTDETHNPHSFRHYFAIEALKAGMPVTAVSQLMGHASITITIESYGKHVDQGLEEIARQYDTLSGL